MAAVYETKALCIKMCRAFSLPKISADIYCKNEKQVDKQKRLV